MSALQFTRRECKEKRTKQQSDQCPLLPTPPDPCMNWTSHYVNNNNNEYLERLTRTGPKRLHVLYKYILSKFNAYNMNAHTHARTHRPARTRTHTHTKKTCVCVCVCVFPYWFVAQISPSAKLQNLERLGMWWSLNFVRFCEGARLFFIADVSHKVTMHFTWSVRFVFVCATVYNENVFTDQTICVTSPVTSGHGSEPWNVDGGQIRIRKGHKSFTILR